MQRRVHFELEYRLQMHKYNHIRPPEHVEEEVDDHKQQQEEVYQQKEKLWHHNVPRVHRRTVQREWNGLGNGVALLPERWNLNYEWQLHPLHRRADMLINYNSSTHDHEQQQEEVDIIPKEIDIIP